MSDADSGVIVTASAHDTPRDQDAGHGSSHGHVHDDDGEPLGPPDFIAWAYAIAGGAVGLVAAIALYAAAHI